MIQSDKVDKNLEICAFMLPVYGGDKQESLRRSLESILAQSINSFSIRIYLGVDGPLDETLEKVVEEFRSRIYKIVRSPIRQGVACNLNAIIRELESERFVFRMDADDVCLPNRVSLQLSYLKKYPEIGILGGAIQEIGPDGRNYGIRTYPQRWEIKDYMRYASPLAHPTVAFRREALDILGGYPLAGSNEDIQMWFAAIQKGIEIDNLTETVLLYQVNDEFYNRRNYSKAFGEAKAYIIGNYRLHGISWTLLLPFMRLFFRLMPSQIVKIIYHNSPIRKVFLNIQPRERE